jgi:hypothetical protein
MPWLPLRIPPAPGFPPYMATDVDYVMSALARTLVGVRDTTTARIAEYRAQNQIGCLRAE